MPNVKLVHFCSGFHGLGGVESVLNRHWEEDSKRGISSDFIVYFETEPPASQSRRRVHYLGLDPKTTIRTSRNKIAGIIAKIQPDISVFHGMWGMPYLADLDQTKRRILLLHGDVPRLEELLRSRGPWVDGILCVSKPLQASVRSHLPRMDPERIGFIPYPIATQVVDRQRPPWGAAPLVIGFCGRLVKEQKRVDRLPELFRHLDAARLDYRVEFLGDGPERSWLEHQFSGDSRMTFHGRKAGEEYWRIVNNWDVILFVSDYEGTPIALLEALSQGVIPIYPRIASGGDAYTESIGRDYLYSPTDFGHVAGVLNQMARQNSFTIAELQERCRQSVSEHLGDNYQRVFSEFIQQIQSTARVGTNAFPMRPFPIDHFSFTSLEKLGAIRRTVLNFVGKV